jgi:hypothetical protein
MLTCQDNYIHSDKILGVKTFQGVGIMLHCVSQVSMSEKDNRNSVKGEKRACWTRVTHIAKGHDRVKPSLPIDSKVTGLPEGECSNRLSEVNSNSLNVVSQWVSRAY